MARLEREATGAIELLEAVDARMSEALAVLNRDGPTAITQLAAAASGFSHHAAISEAMEDIQIAIAGLSETDPDLRAAGDTCRPLLQHLYRNYTMEAERRTHQDLFGIDASAPVIGGRPANDSAAAEGDLEDIFF